jgi:hypothetical protein
MAEFETYVTKTDPSVEDWLEYNRELFSRLKNEDDAGSAQYAPLVDVDRHAAAAGVGTEEYFEQVKEKAGPLGRAALRLVHSEMDDAWHVVVVPQAPLHSSLDK